MGSEFLNDPLPREGLHAGGKSGNGFAPRSYTEQFYDVFPFYLSIGMTCEQFWDGDCLLVKYYREAHRLRQQRRNGELWVQGAYIYEALADVSPVLHAFAKKGAKPLPYVSEPFPLTRRDVIEKREREERIRYEKQKAKVAAWAAENNMQSLRREVMKDG